MPERNPPADASELRLLSGVLCLDFVNTLDPRSGPWPVDFIRSVDDLIAWGRLADLLDDRDARAIRSALRSDPRRSQQALDDALAVRELVFRTFVALARSSAPDAADLRELSRRYHEASWCFELHHSDDVVRWSIAADRDPIERAVATILRSAVELLTSSRLERVKECAAEGECGWLFLDATRSGTRRWCRMGGCGSRAKARRHYARHVKSRASTSDGPTTPATGGGGRGHRPQPLDAPS